MNSTTDRASWLVKDEAVLAELIDLLALNPAEQALLAALQPAAHEFAPTLTHAFYERLLNHPAAAEYLPSTRLDHMRATLSGWFTELFCGQYDIDYVRRRLSIGKTHVRIGLPVRYPLAMLDLVMAFGESIASQSVQPIATLAAFRKILALDVAIFNQAYEDSQLHHLAELVGGERLARRLLTAEV